MNEQVYVNNKMPLAVFFLVLLSSTDIGTLNRRNQRYAMLSNCIDADRNLKSELFFCKRKYVLSTLEAPFKEIYEHIDEYNWEGYARLMQCFYNVEIKTDSVSNVRNALENMITYRCTDSHLYFDDSFCTRVASLFINKNESLLRDTSKVMQKQSQTPFVNSDIDAVLNYIPSNQIEEVQMAFHAGDIWLDHNRKFNDRLVELLKSGVKIKVIVNTPDAAEIICRHLRPPHQINLTTFSESLKGWKYYESQFEKLQVKVSNVPMMYNYIAFLTKESKESLIRVIYYTYGNTKMSNNLFTVLGTESRYFGLYRHSFEYLWSLREIEIASTPNSATDKPLVRERYVEFITELYERYYSSLQDIDKFREQSESNCNFSPESILNKALTEAQNGEAEAMLIAGIFYFYGFSKGVNNDEASKWFTKAATKGGIVSTIANKYIARLCYAGGMPLQEQSYKKSFEFHLKSMEDEYSLRQVGFMKSIGSGCDFDYEQINEFYNSHKNSFDNLAKYIYGSFYQSHGDFHMAAEIFKSIADDYSEAAFQMGIMYKSGVLAEPIKPDYEQSALYFHKAYERGLRSAAVELGHLYFNPTGTFRKDFVKAQQYYKEAADFGDAEAQYRLGYMYLYGHVNKNIKLAIELFEKSAIQGHILSSAWLGILYQMPEFHDYSKAFVYCRFAAESGDTVSQFVLGMLYLIGRGCNADTNASYRWLKKAEREGVKEASIILKIIQH